MTHFSGVHCYVLRWDKFTYLSLMRTHFIKVFRKRQFFGKNIPFLSRINNKNTEDYKKTFRFLKIMSRRQD